MLNLFIQDFVSNKHCYFSVIDKEEELFYYHSSVISLSKDYKAWEMEKKNPLIDWIDRNFLCVCS